MKYFIANWKANKNLVETKSWVNEFFEKFDQDLKTKQKLLDDYIKIIICPPFPLLYPLKELLNERKNIFVGCQDISSIEGGTYTGEVPAHSLESIVEYAIIGHSERKKYLHETADDVTKKYAISRGDGRGNNIPSVEIIEVRNRMKLPEGAKFIYGGSINKDNVGEYLQHEEIDGFLSGGASLDPLHFYTMISLS
ncbi:triosephosphate isomerase [Candidatus Roizmanbacteria bacterium]|nr:triosephosphate isomerase [Candidatus Roizmanbacteria bacterium]